MQVHITKYRATAMWTWDVDESGSKRKETEKGNKKTSMRHSGKRPRGVGERDDDRDDDDDDDENGDSDDDEDDEIDEDVHHLAGTAASSSTAATLDDGASDEGICGICRQPFDATCPNCKYAGEDCPPVFGHCHVFHMHCIEKWLEASTTQGKPHCPLCRSEWQYRAD